LQVAAPECFLDLEEAGEAIRETWSRVEGNYELMAYQTSSTKGSGYGNTLIDSLIWGCQWTNSPSYAGTFTNSSPVEITYDFASLGYWTLAGKTTYAASWSSEYIGVVEAALSTYENFCNVNFTYSTNNANLKFFQLPSTYWSQAGVLGECDVPDGTYNWNAAKFNYESTSWFYNVPGGDGWYTIIHELGHGLGLAHPHDGGSGDNPTKFPGVINSTDIGTYGLNQGIWTIMSYNSDWNTEPTTSLAFGAPITPMALDIAALQKIYGANTTFNTGSNNYSLPKSNTFFTGWVCIWDAGGDDLITNSDSINDCVINLNQAPLTGTNAGGYVSWIPGIKGGFTIANGVIVENAIGGLGNDIIIGNEVSNSLSGGSGNDQLYGYGGNDSINGGDGSDTVYFSGKYSDYLIVKSGASYSISAKSGIEGTDSIVNCEFFCFSDVTKTLFNLIVDLTAPVFQNASSSADGTKITLTYNESLGSTVPGAKAFVVTVAGKAVTVSSVAAVDSTIELTLASAIKSSQVTTVTYTAPKVDVGTSNAAIQDTSGNDAVKLSSTSVTNNSTLPAPDQTAPVFQNASSSADGTKITLTYNESLGSTVPGAKAFVVTVAGKAVTVSSVAAVDSTIELTLASAIKSSQVTTVTYTAPKVDVGTSNAAIQDTSGNDAVKFSKSTVLNLSNLMFSQADTGASKIASQTVSLQGQSIDHTVQLIGVNNFEQFITPDFVG